MTRVVIVSRMLAQYRVEFYNLLRELLSESGIELILVYGDGNQDDAAKLDQVDLEWGHAVPNRIINVLGQSLYWQPAMKYLRGADLVIVEQASRLLLNYLLQVGQLFGGPRLAFWGHGRNFQAEAHHGLAERLKKQYSKHVHWWFAYNNLSANTVSALGFPSERITIVDNAIDTKSIRVTTAEQRGKRRDDIRKQYGVVGDAVAVYVGGLYSEKRLDFLIEAGHLIRQRIADFELVIAGGGVERSKVEAASRMHSWIKYVGPKFGVEKSEVLAIAKCFLMPGLVGLAILDAFAAGLPIVTTRVPFHSPEIEYLKSGVNGVMTDVDVNAYADAVINLMLNGDQLTAMSRAAEETAGHYTVENMAQNFAQGIIAALE